VADGSPPVVILDNIPANFAHNGGFIHFGSDGMLYIIVGENEVSSSAQDLTSLRGKILRVNPADGSAPGDNPFVTNANANAKKVYSLGHRNGFGFTFHSHTNDLWESENGENCCDEINRIRAGQNYGWPFISGIGSDPINCSTCINPIFDSMAERLAPTGIVAFREDSAYPMQYHNNLLFADFNFGQLHRIVLGGPSLTDLVSHSKACDPVASCGQGGLIAVMHGLNVPGQDGYIYVSSATGSIFRVVVNP
jgi:glucose/arabinose dehydrogenase